ncbi:MAG TPA: hypothetical protein PKW21_15030 [Rhabdaerophilum sp.]|nr:hypothetical protein [Rhabdaerophilum sp.]
MPPDRPEINAVDGQYSATFDAVAKMPLDQQLRHYSEQVARLPGGRRNLDRVQRAGDSMKARHAADTEKARERHEQQLREAMLRRRSAQPTLVPNYVAGTTGQSIRLTERERQNIVADTKQAAGEVAEQATAAYRDLIMQKQVSILKGVIDRDAARTQQAAETADRQQNVAGEPVKESPRATFERASRGERPSQRQGRSTGRSPDQELDQGLGE